jgi:Fe-S cluster assembly protein SufD
MTDAGVERFVADFSRHASSLPGAGIAWLARLRRTSIERFTQRGLPTSRDEEWKYTSVAAIAKRPFAVPGSSGSGSGDVDVGPYAMAGMPSHRIVFVDGRYAPALSQIGALPRGVTLASLRGVLDRPPDTLEPLLATNEHHTVFAALNAAFFCDGLYLHVPRGTVLAEPVHALFLSTMRDAAIHPRNLVMAEDGAQFTLIEHYAGLEEAASLTNAVTQIAAAAGSSIAHYKLQQEAPRALHVAGIHASQSRASRFASHSIALGAALARNDITTAFDGEGCDAELNGLFLAGGRQHVDHHTRIDHANPHGTSREYYKGVLDGAARGVFNGKVIVHPGAQKTNAHLASHNLLLAKTAEIDAKPELQIDADDVKCAHGATVGQLDDAQMFYLRSRGVDESLARALLTYAFANDVIERVRIAPLRDAVKRVLFARLPQGERIRELLT